MSAILLKMNVLRFNFILIMNFVPTALQADREYRTDDFSRRRARKNIYK